jgi:hypothetical protein
MDKLTLEKKIFPVVFDVLCGNKHFVIISSDTNITKGKAVPLQVWSGPEVSRKLKFPDFVTTAQNCSRLSALRNGRLYPQEMLLVLEAESIPGP